MAYILTYYINVSISFRSRDEHFMFKVCLFVINILSLNWGLEGRGVKTPGWQHGVCHFPLAMLAAKFGV